MDQSNSDQQSETDNKRQVNELRLQAMRLLIDDGHNLSPSSLHKAIEALSARFEEAEQPEPLNRLSARFTTALAELLSDERVSTKVREQFRDAINEVDRLAGPLMDTTRPPLIVAWLPEAITRLSKKEGQGNE